MCIVFDETEAAGCFLKSVEAHDQSFYFTTSGDDPVSNFSFDPVAAELKQRCLLGE